MRFLSKITIDDDFDAMDSSGGGSTSRNLPSAAGLLAQRVQAIITTTNINELMCMLERTNKQDVG